MSLVSALPLTIAQEFLDGTVKKLVEAIRSEAGVTLQDAKDILGNFLFDLSVNASIIGAVIKTKVALKTLDYLGIRNRTVIKKVLSTGAQKGLARIAGPWEKFKSFSLLSKILTVIGVGNLAVWQAKSLADIVEPGIYQTKQTNALYRKLGIPFQYPTSAGGLAPGNFDASTFARTATALEASGIKGISNPVALQSQLYSRENLADVFDYVYGKAVLSGNTPSDWRGTLKLAQPFLIGGTVPEEAKTVEKKGALPVSSIRQTKAFTGVVSQGVLGSNTIFRSRPDDLIEDMEELQEAINNNVAPWIAALANDIRYEVKVVSSIIVDGLRLVGEAQRIVSGTNSDGTQRFKTIYNKFAVVKMYYVKNEDQRVLLDEIVLGPTDATGFQPNSAELLEIGAVVNQNVLTNSTDDISRIVSNTPTQEITLRTAEEIKEETGLDVEFIGNVPVPKSVRLPILSVPPEFYTQRAPEGRTRQVEKVSIGKLLGSTQTLQESLGIIAQMIGEFGEQSIHSVTLEWYKNLTQEDRDIINGKQIFQAVARPEEQSSASEPASSSPESGQQTQLPPGALTATTLFAYFQALDKPLPDLTERASMYEQFGLGQASLYVGSIEQNSKLLDALKANPL